MSATIPYAGKTLRISTAKDAHDFMRLIARDLTGVRQDVANLVEDHRQTAKKLEQGNAVSPLSLMSAFPVIGQRPVAAPTPAPAPVQVTPSVHRSAVPTITSQGVDVTASILPGSVDRVIRLVADFTGPYQGGSQVCTIAFGAAYAAAPAIQIQQKGSPGLVNLRPLTVTATTLVLTADNAQGVTVEFDIVVTPSTESFD